MDDFRDFSERHLQTLRTASLLAFVIGTGATVYLRRPQLIRRFTNVERLPNFGRPLTYRGRVHAVQDSIILIQHIPTFRLWSSPFDVATDCLKVRLVGISNGPEVDATIAEMIGGKAIKFVPLAINTADNVAEADVFCKKKLFFSSLSYRLIAESLALKANVPSQGFQTMFDLDAYETSLESAKAIALKRERSKMRKLLKWVYKFIRRS